MNNEFKNLLDAIDRHQVKTGKSIGVVKMSQDYFNKVYESEKHYTRAEGYFESVAHVVFYHIEENQSEDYIFA